MKIMYLKLVNYASIFAGMSRTAIEIDFSNNNKRVILLKGPNGSGKTSILSQLHPFVYNKEDENKNNNELILKDKDGYKEIHFYNGEDTFIIKHFITNKGDRRTIKSFFARNGVELNENGNVTSFLEMVNIHLGITQDFLRLIRLGPQVTTFIRLKDSGRKEYASLLLEEVGAYLKFLKNATQEVRTLKNTLKITIEKINRLKITSEYELDDSIDELQKRIEEYQNRLNQFTNDIGELTGAIKSKYHNTEELSVKIFNLKNRKDEYPKVINKMKKAIDKSNEVINEDTINSLERNIEKLKFQITQDKTVFDIYMKNISTMYNNKEEKIKTINSINTGYLDDIDKTINEMENERDILSNKLDKISIDTDCTSQDLEQLISISQSINFIINDIKTVSRSTISDCIDKYTKGSSIDKYANNQLSLLSSNISKLESRISACKVNDSGFIYIMYNPEGCTEEKCPYREFYDDHMKKEDSTTEIDKLKKEVRMNEYRMERFNDMIFISNKISLINSILNSNSRVINITNSKSVCNMSNILNFCIEGDGIFFDERLITSRIDNLQLKEEYESILTKLDKLYRERDIIKDNNKILDSLNKELENINNNLTKDETSAEELREKLIKNENELEDSNNRLIEIKTLYDAQQNLSKVEEEYNLVEKEYNYFKSLEDEIKAYKDKIGILIGEREEINLYLRSFRNKLDELRYTKREFISLKEEKEMLEEEYDDKFIIKEALSNKEGIPIEFQKTYLQSTMMVANDLLDIVYKGDLYLEEFEIDESNFKIPFNRRGLSIGDVSSASQGEESIINIALSFALMYQSIDEYNIPLLDEMDGPLDVDYRLHFLEIMEKFSKMKNIEQMVVISHNNVFQGYDVDVISTDIDDPGTILIK